MLVYTLGLFSFCCLSIICIVYVGLDSTAATSLVETLRGLANEGKTIVAVIHQPSQHVFAAFDDLLLMSEGRQMYFGEVSAVRNYMNGNARIAPAEMGTAEHILDCVSKAPLKGESTDDAQTRIDHLAEIANSVTKDLGRTDGKVQRFVGDQHGGPKSNILVQFKLLLKRALGENFRGKTTLILKTIQQVSLGLIYGGIYSIGTNQVRLFVEKT